MKLEIKVIDFATAEYKPSELKKVFRAASTEIVQIAKQMLRSAPSNGRLYYGSGGANTDRPYKPGRHHASAPGGIPAQFTGVTASKIKGVPFKSGEGFFVKSNAFWSSALEYGHATKKEKASGRPFLDKALALRSDSITRRIQDAIEQDIKFVKEKVPRK